MIDSYLLIGTHRIVKDLDRETTRICAAYGLTFPQFMVLEALLHKNRMTVGEIMLMYGKEASNRKQEIDRQHYTIPNQRPKDKHCGKI